MKPQTASARCGRSAGLPAKAFGDGWVCDRLWAWACQLVRRSGSIAFITSYRLPKADGKSNATRILTRLFHK
jgi:hypothetical protein